MSQPVVRVTAPAAALWATALDPLAACACGAILVVATMTRLFQLGRLSFWYDEVVTMRLARSGSLGALFRLLFQIDATRAPLHPLFLHAWIRVFGASEAQARSLSVLFGIVTVLLIFEIGRVTFDFSTGVWAAWLAALSPILIVYSREARMYAWLVLVTCLCWRLLLALRSAYTPANASGYVVGATALVYSHPLGLLMLGALAVAGLIEVETCFGTWKRWLYLHLAIILLILPWLGNYLDHPPEFLSGRLPLRYLLGTPIGFIGGNFVLLFFLTLLIGKGLVRHRFPIAPGGVRIPLRRRWAAPGFLLLWLILPPMALYLYSWLSYPVFGPARYTVFVAPAYLILVAAGLSQMPPWGRYPLALVLAIASSRALGPLVYDPALKADWRDFAVAITRELADHPRRAAVVILASADSDRDVNLETARYYLPEDCAVIAYPDATAERLGQLDDAEVYLTVGTRGPLHPVPEVLGPYHFRQAGHYPGLIVYRGVR
jgi:uncharacterized membrane protein